MWCESGVLMAMDGGHSVEVDVEGVFLLLVFTTLRLACRRGGGAWAGCGLLFVVLLAHVEGSDGGVLVVEPGWGLTMSRVRVVGGGEVDGEGFVVVVVLAWVQRVLPDCLFW